MIPVLIVCAIFFSMLWYTVFYILSVSPAQFTRKNGGSAYKMCAILRKAAFAGMFLCMAAEILFFFFPLKMGIPERIIGDTIGWIISISCGILEAILATLLIRKVSTVATESFVPDQKNQMFGGIYDKIRHPQAIADVGYWFALAFLFNSLFLLLVAIIWVPINIAIALFEEKDLKVRFGAKYIEYMERTPRFVPRHFWKIK
jgi:protein-S-isoprenylcysteine O-methyltransferase Ste14